MGGHGIAARAVPITNKWAVGLNRKRPPKEGNHPFLFSAFLHTRTGRTSITKPIKISIAARIFDPYLRFPSVPVNAAPAQPTPSPSIKHMKTLPAEKTT
ncbi:conserved domain protein [delta proteobacterium NaphS2]|nr:conserved domain protein [delta proteobacterium NaphS2]